MNFLHSVPYENFSKAIKFHSENGNPARAFRLSSELMNDHRTLGTGGTCFSLSWYLHHFLKQEGLVSRLVMCDRSYGQNTHCAVVVSQGDEHYLLDPGFLSYLPIQILNNSISRVETPYHSIYLEPRGGGNNEFDLYTFYRNERKYRFTLKDTGVGEEEFKKHWEKSFITEFMEKPVVSQLKEDKHFYLQGLNLYVRDRHGSKRTLLTKDNFVSTIKDIFGLNEQVSRHALEIFY